MRSKIPPARKVTTMPRSDYLTYGGNRGAAGLRAADTQAWLESQGFDRGELRAARQAVGALQVAEFTFDAIGGRYCDFCFVLIMGGEYEQLNDGRERCTRCSKTVLSTEEQFVEEFAKVRSNMEVAFSVTLNAPTIVKMVNAREIARRTGETFTATPGVDPRVLGFALKTGNGHELFLENGAPRLAAITTMAHELTHIWQYGNWDEGAITKAYGAGNRLAVYEGMATWTQVQYLIFTRDFDYAQRQHAYALMREDEYGVGYRVFLDRYPLSLDGDPGKESPFHHDLPL